MVDFVSKEKRSRIMRGVKQADTKPEMTVRRTLHRMGYRFRLHKRDLPGCPDIVLRKHNTVIFVHGCFWHQHDGCKDGHVPDSNVDYWRSKLKRNKERDTENIRKLTTLGWNVQIIWECEIKDPQKLEKKISEIIAQADET